MVLSTGWCEDYSSFPFYSFSQGGVGRVHLLDSNIQGALLLELYTRDGVGTMVSRCVGDSS